MLNSSIKLDLRSRRILEILAQNCRTSHASIAAALNVSKDTVAYRIRRLEEEKFIERFMLFIDARLLGFTRHHLLLQFESGFTLSAEIHRKICEHPFVMWVNSFVGKYDLQIIIDATDNFHLNSLREEIFALCKQKVRNYTILTHIWDLEFTQLNPYLDLGTRLERTADASFGNLLSRRNFPVSPKFTRYKTAKTEAKILSCLADDPRATLSELAEKLSLDRQTIKRQILSLIQAGVILNFGAIPSLMRLGYITYYLLVRLRQDTPLTAMRHPFEKLRNIFYAGRMLGEYDLLLYLNARNPQELNASISQFRSDMAKYILNYDLLVQDAVLHWRQYTAGINHKLLDQ